MQRSRQAVSFFFGFCLLLAAPVVSQGAPPAAPGGSPSADSSAGEWEAVGSFGEEISVDVVNVAVWVTDEHGRPVTGLTQDDFELLEDGAPREIANFAAFEGSATAPEAPVAEAPSEARPEVAPAESAAPQAAPLHLVVLVDNWNLRPEGRARVFHDLRQFIASHLAPGDQVAIMVHDRALQLVQGFTDNPRRVATTLDRIEKVSPGGVEMRLERRDALNSIERAYREHNEVGASRAKGGQCSDGWGQMENAATQYAAAVQGHVQQSGGALVSVANILAGLPDGQRVVVYVGNGLAQSPGLELFQHLAELCPHRQSELAFYYRDYDMSWLYQQVAEHANAAGVTFFTIEAEAPGIDLGIDSQNPGGLDATGQGVSFRTSQTAQSLGSHDQEDSLSLIARETGGRAILNAPDLSSEFDRLALDLRNYYSLGFHPATPGDGKLHPLEVRLTDGKKYRIRYRTEYQDKPLEVRMVERLRGVAQFGGEQNPLGVRIETGEAVPEEVAFRVPLRIWVPLDKVTLVPQEAGGKSGESGELAGRLRVLMTTTSANGELQPVRQKIVPVTVQGGEKGLSGEQLIEVEVELPPGEQTVAVAVRDGLGGTTSYLRHQFKVVAGPVQASAHQDG